MLRLVTQIHDVTIDDLKSSSRKARIVEPRQITCYLARMLTPLSLPQIGQAMGRRDHTTILHAVRTIEQRTQDDPQLAAMIRAYRVLLTPLL
nr:helix-turn-helix domain-containing protein [Beijerinckia indica]